MKWRNFVRERGSVDTPDWSSRRDKAARNLDPLTYWAKSTAFRGFLLGKERWIRVAVELDSDKQRKAVLSQLDEDGQGDRLRVSKHYRERLAKRGCRFFTARAHVDTLAELARIVKRIKPGFVGSAESAADGGQPKAASRDVPQAERPKLAHLHDSVLRNSFIERMKTDIVKGARRQTEGHANLAAPPQYPRAKPLEGSRAPMLAIIDFGCAFAHPHFGNVAADGLPSTRVVHFWDQGREAGAGLESSMEETWPWIPQDDFGYGREANRERLDRLIRAAAVTEPRSGWRLEEACYVAAGLPELLGPWSHGTAVMDLAAGWPKPLKAEQTADPAAAADIIFVQLPQQAVEDLSGAWLSVYVLDALEYIMNRANGRKVVVNISLGSHAGPHDGASLLEAALDQHASAASVAGIVLAAGNTASKMGHASATLTGKKSASLTWAVPGGDPTQSFLEFWYSIPEGVPASKGLVFEIKHSMVGSCRVKTGAVTLDARESGDPTGRMAAFVHVPRSEGGRNSGTALLALAPTVVGRGADASWLHPAPSGNWTITVTNPSDQPVTIHAWIERDEPGASTFVDRVSSVLVCEDDSAFKMSTDCTLTGQATGIKTRVVGSVIHAIDGSGDMADSDSGRGPSRSLLPGARQAPDTFAPGSLLVNGLRQGIPVTANRSWDPADPTPGLTRATVVLSGTSLAAASAARELYNETCRQESIEIMRTSPKRPPRGPKRRSAPPISPTPLPPTSVPVWGAPIRGDDPPHA